MLELVEFIVYKIALPMFIESIPLILSALDYVRHALCMQLCSSTFLIFPVFLIQCLRDDELNRVEFERHHFHSQIILQLVFCIFARSNTNNSLFEIHF